MMKHKWHKEIKAWADGAEIEMKFPDTDWLQNMNLMWDLDDAEFRIKPQPKKPQYLYVYARNGEVNYIYDEPRGWAEDFVGKIKLEVDDE
jgi:hypothetical protein